MIEYSIAGKEQLPGILALYRQLVPDDDALNADEAEKIWAKSQEHDITYFVASDGNKVVSSLYLAVIPNLTRNGRSNGFIENVVTDGDYRRKGIGKKLMQMALDYAKEKNCYKAVLLSGIERKEAHQFYVSCGFNGNSKQGFEIRL